MDIKEVISSVQKSPHTKVKLAVIDIDGILRGKVMRKDKFLSALESGFGFCNVVFGFTVFDSILSFHCTGSVGMFFNIDQIPGAFVFGVFRTPLVMP